MGGGQRAESRHGGGNGGVSERHLFGISLSLSLSVSLEEQYYALNDSAAVSQRNVSPGLAE